MATATFDDGVDDDPVDSPDGYDYESRPGKDVWTHRETGLTVTVRKNRRPTQMHTPETSTDDVGYAASVRGGPDDVGESLSLNDLGHKDVQRQTALEFMETYPDGGYVPELRTGFDADRIHWRPDDDTEGDDD